MSGAIGEFERNLIRERTTAGLRVARARGRKDGRQRSLSDKDLAMARAMLTDEHLSVADVCEGLGISIATL